MLLQFYNQDVLLIMNEEDKTKLLSMIDSINSKIEILKNTINKFNNKNAFFDFQCSKLFGKQTSSHLLIKIYGASFDLYSLKIKHSLTSFSKEKLKNEIFNTLFTSFDFELFQKEMIEFDKLYQQLLKKYMIKPFEYYISKIKQMILVNYDKNIIQINIRSDFESNTFYLGVYAPRLEEYNMYEKANYANKTFPDLISLLNINFQSLFNQFIKDEADYQEIRFDSNIVFEKIKLIENMNNF